MTKPIDRRFAINELLFFQMEVTNMGIEKKLTFQDKPYQIGKMGNPCQILLVLWD